MRTPPPSIAVVGPSGSGKTTLIENLVPALRRKGLRVGVLKHAHHGFQMDREGKDTWRISNAGADGVVVIGPTGLVEKRPSAPNLDEAIRRLDDLDLIFVEGFRTSDLPKIAIASDEKPWPYDPPDRVLAAVGRAPAPGGAPRFGPDESARLALFLIEALGLTRKIEAPLGGILAGGEGRRMGGIDKALFEFDGLPLIDRAVNLLAPFVREVVVLSSRHEDDLNGLRVLPDAARRGGPLGGVVAGLRSAGPSGLVAVPCDMPYLKSGSIEKILEARGSGADLVIAKVEDNPIPVLGWYGPGAIAILEAELRRPRCRLYHALNELDTSFVEIPPEEARDIDYPPPGSGIS